MSHRQITSLFAQNKALKTCLNNAAKYSTAAERTRMAQKNISFDPSSTAQKAREAAVFAREQYTGDIKNRTPTHSPSIIKPTIEETDHENKGAIVSGIEVQHQEKMSEDAYWEEQKQEKKQRSSAKKENSKNKLNVPAI